MYPVKLGFNEAKNRIERLIKNEHHAEALLTAFFTFEKTVNRTLKQLIVSAGFRNKHADTLLNKLHGFDRKSDLWACFDPSGRKLPEIIGNNHWQHIQKAKKMRNNLAHGSRVYNLCTCKEVTENMLDSINQTVSCFRREYGYDGWSALSVRYKSTLHSDPKVNVLNV